MRDHARASVSGRSHYGTSNNPQKSRSRIRRAKLQAATKFHQGIRCSASLECECELCEYDDHGPAVVKHFEHKWWGPGHRDHLKPGYRMAAKKLVEFDGDFDPWFSWLKKNLPDTLAGRHLLDHIVSNFCSCIENSKYNYNGCSCHADLRTWAGEWPKDSPGDFWVPKHGEPDVATALAKLQELNGDTESWIEWLSEQFAASTSGKARMIEIRDAIWCEVGETTKSTCQCWHCWHKRYLAGYEFRRPIFDFVYSLGLEHKEAEQLLKQMWTQLGRVHVRRLIAHASNDFLFDPTDPSSIRVYPTHIESRSQFEGSHYDPTSNLRWKVDFIVQIQHEADVL